MVCIKRQHIKFFVGERDGLHKKAAYQICFLGEGEE